MDTTRSKHVETLRGKGKVYEGETYLCDVSYRLYVYQDVVTSRTFKQTSSAEGHPEITGAISECDMFDLLGKKNLTLHLKDGRRLKFFVRNDKGQITATGGFYTPDSE